MRDRKGCKDTPKGCKDTTSFNQNNISNILNRFLPIAGLKDCILEYALHPSEYVTKLVGREDAAYQIAQYCLRLLKQSGVHAARYCLLNMESSAKVHLFATWQKSPNLSYKLLVLFFKEIEFWSDAELNLLQDLKVLANEEDIPPELIAFLKRKLQCRQEKMATQFDVVNECLLALEKNLLSYENNNRLADDDENEFEDICLHAAESFGTEERQKIKLLHKEVISIVEMSEKLLKIHPRLGRLSTGSLATGTLSTATSLFYGLLARSSDGEDLNFLISMCCGWIKMSAQADREYLQGAESDYDDALNFLYSACKGTQLMPHEQTTRHLFALANDELKLDPLNESKIINLAIKTAEPKNKIYIAALYTKQFEIFEKCSPNMKLIPGLKKICSELMTLGKLELTEDNYSDHVNLIKNLLSIYRRQSFYPKALFEQLFNICSNQEIYKNYLLKNPLAKQHVCLPLYHWMLAEKPTCKFFPAENKQISGIECFIAFYLLQSNHLGQFNYRLSTLRISEIKFFEELYKVIQNVLQNKSEDAGKNKKVNHHI